MFRAITYLFLSYLTFYFCSFYDHIAFLIHPVSVDILKNWYDSILATTA